jgi:hypothetical protein
VERDQPASVSSGRIHLHIGPPLSIVPLFKAGKAKVVAVAGDEPLVTRPEAPTLKEIRSSARPLRMAWRVRGHAAAGG